MKCNQAGIFDESLHSYRDCNNEAEFVFEEDKISEGNAFCWEHIGEHLHYCNDLGSGLKRVSLELRKK